MTVPKEKHVFWVDVSMLVRPSLALKVSCVVMESAVTTHVTVLAVLVGPFVSKASANLMLALLRSVSPVKLAAKGSVSTLVLGKTVPPRNVASKASALMIPVKASLAKQVKSVWVESVLQILALRCNAPKDGFVTLLQTSVWMILV